MADKSAYAAKPSSLKAPVPGKEAAMTADDFLASFDAPEMAAAEPSHADDFVENVSATLPPPQDPRLNQPVEEESFPVQEDPSAFNIKQQLEDLPTRVAANIAGDPDSVKLTLEKRFGPENVKQKGSAFYFKKPGEKAFRKLDPNTFEVVNDLFADFYKETIQGVGGAAGAIGGAPAGPGGAIAGTALGVGAATAAVDAYGENALGVVRSPNRPQGALARTGEALQTGAEYAAIDGVFKGMLSRWQARRAKTEGLRKLSEISPEDRLTESVKTNLETLNEMKSLGLTSKVPGTNIEVPAHQLYPHLPEVQKTASSVAAEKSFQQAQKEAAENFGMAALDLAEEASKISKGKLAQAVKTGVPGAKQVSAAEVNGLFNSVRKAEGQLIGEFRKKALQAAEKTPLPSPKTNETVRGMFEQLGVTMKDGKLQFPDDDSLMQVLGTDSKAFVNGLKSDLTKIGNKLTQGGGLTIDELLGQSQIIGAKNEGARRVGGMYKTLIGKLSSALREDSRNGVASVLNPEDAVEYMARMKRFSSISKSMDQLDNYLRDDIGMNTFAKGLVNKGKEGLANLKAAKEFLFQENPQMYKNLIGEYMEELALKHRSADKVSGYNAASMKKELLGLGKEYLDELFPKNGKINKGLVLRSFDLADQVERSIIKDTDAELLKEARKSMASLSYWAGKGINAVYSLGKFGSKDARLLKMLSREGVESFLKETPKGNREKMRQTLNGILNIARANGTLATVQSATKGAAYGQAVNRYPEAKPQPLPAPNDEI